ncbi:hypothetical protein KGY58_00375 [Candidatus Bipolaricaulota bacterium]|nr:hypothetical protein [Candidatus Bipolaricaulota bacterium]
MSSTQGTQSGIIRDLNEMPTPEDGFQGELECKPEEANVGEEVEISGTGLPSDSEYELLWRSYEVDWDIEKNEDGVLWGKFLGFTHQERQRILDSVKTGLEGEFTTSIKIPEDYGASHDIYLISEEKRINKVRVLVVPSFSVTPDSGPLGSTITIKAKGLPLPIPRSVDNSLYNIYYDNKHTGMISPVTPKGSAEVELPATGQPGTHVIDVERCPFGNTGSYRQTHLGLTSMPGTVDLSWTFELTEEDPVLPPPIDQQIPEKVLREDTGPAETDAPAITTREKAIPVTDSVKIEGSGFPPEARVDLNWSLIEGNDLREDVRKNEEYTETTVLTETVLVGEDGKFLADVTPAPESVQGGPQPIHAVIDGKKVATTSVIVLPVLEQLQPEVARAGDQVTIKGRGVGWNETWNQATILYDNSYIGYVCGGDIPGIVEGKLKATGRPGWHIIDIYPTIEKQWNFAKEAFEVPFIYRRPFLNWNSHPQGYHFRYAFKVEE